MSRTFRCLLPAALLLAALPAAAHAAPMPPGPPTTSPTFAGAPATAKAFTPVDAEQNPFMTKNPRSNIHNDTWMSGAYNTAGPLGRRLRTFSGAHPASLCGSITFDSKGRLIAVCPSAAAPPVIRMFDPKSLDVLAEYTL